MRIYFISILVFLNLNTVYCQEEKLKIVILGAAHAGHCEFDLNPDIEFVNQSVADFTSGQLYWNVNRVVDASPDICVIQTGGLDLLLGIPDKKVIENLDKFYNHLDKHNIRLIIMEDFPYWEEENLGEAFSGLNEEIRIFCKGHKIPFVSAQDVGIEKSQINPRNEPVLTHTGYQKLQAAIIKTAGYEFQN